MDAATAYFLKKYYPHVIKWWLVTYDPNIVRIWPSKAEEEEALRLEAQEGARKALGTKGTDDPISDAGIVWDSDKPVIDEDAYNATTGSYSGLYGKKPVDADTQAALDAIMHSSSNQSSIDHLLAGGQPVSSAAYDFTEKKNDFSMNDDIIVPTDQAEILREANEIYERLLREAAEDEAKKQAEIEAARSIYENNAI